MPHPLTLMEAPVALGIKGLKGHVAPYKGVYGQRDKDEHGYWQYQNELDRSKWLCYVGWGWMLQRRSGIWRYQPLL